MSDIKRLIRDTAAAPLGDIIASVGEGVAQAQRALDGQALAQLEALYRDQDEATALLRQSGWRPTFYTIPETEGEVKVALSLGGQGEETTTARSSGILPRKSRVALYGAPVDAGYQNRFGYQATIGASLRFRIVPVPPPGDIDALPIRVVPDLSGSSRDEAAELLAQFGLALTLDAQSPEAGQVVAQRPLPGQMLRQDDVVSVTLGPAD
ncbi:PASTA domain-containing protein [Halomonas shengliensis]|uniref:PASTA domain-containing protein n=1 Tax=Halomonas shengliensis TaxID=419597 RepID=A0A1H0LQE9_9GAMM|nr:PASTA domain-containing protein [Halomonas shengliensis]SDO70418.1 PASTA domain-containing protein [Halomonas shengliensis]